MYVYWGRENRTQGKILQSHALAPADLHQLHRHDNFWMKNNSISTLCPIDNGASKQRLHSQVSTIFKCPAMAYDTERGQICLGICYVLGSKLGAGELHTNKIQSLPSGRTYFIIVWCVQLCVTPGNCSYFGSLMTYF